MKLGDPNPSSAAGSAQRWSDATADTAVERAVHDFQRGLDREKSFEVLFRRFQPRIERFLSPRVFSPEERLDLTQVIFLRIYQGLDGYRGEGSLDGWVLQVAFNAYRKWRDRQPGGRRAVPEIALDPAEVPESSTAANPLSTSVPSSALDLVERRERLQALREAVAELPPKQRLCMELRVYQERSVKEIAVALRISPETVKAHLFQARHRLWDKLSDAFGTIEL